MEKIAALSCSLSAILTTMKSKLNYFSDFSESTFFAEAKLEAEFTQILKFLRLPYLFGESYMLTMNVQNIQGKFKKNSKSGHFEVSAIRTKKKN